MIKLFKQFRKKYPQWDDLKHSITFYRWNPHSIPVVSNLLCKLGRHDYEPLYLNKDKKSIVLECFYCQRRKVSILSL